MIGHWSERVRDELEAATEEGSERVCRWYMLHLPATGANAAVHS